MYSPETPKSSVPYTCKIFPNTILLIVSYLKFFILIILRINNVKLYNLTAKNKHSSSRGSKFVENMTPLGAYQCTCSPSIFTHLTMNSAQTQTHAIAITNTTHKPPVSCIAKQNANNGRSSGVISILISICGSCLMLVFATSAFICRRILLLKPRAWCFAIRRRHHD